MPLDYAVWAGLLAASLLAIVLLSVLLVRAKTGPDPELLVGIRQIAADLGALRGGLAEDLRRGREESGATARDLRTEIQALVARLGESLSGAFSSVGAGQTKAIALIAADIRALAEANERRLHEMRKDGVESGAALRGEVITQLGALADLLGQKLDGAAKAQGERLDAGAASQTERLDGVAAQIRRLIQSSTEAHEQIRTIVEQRLEQLRGDNSAKLEDIRKTVDEKLQGTLEERLGEKFKIVSHQLEQVHRSVGEMQSLATGVGDLKRVLTNVKTRGTWAEVSLGVLLEQVMAPDQFVRNVETVPDSGQRVEFAIRMPGQSEGETILLPIDAKFPIEDYERLLEASEQADAGLVEVALRGLETRIKQEGAKICAKYVSPPHTTDFGILYLPTEGLYAEVLRRPGLVDHLQGQCRIMVAGPTNLHAFLTSLRMGFRTLAIERRSSEVWSTLSAVKTEFATYGDVLDRVKKKLAEASTHLESVSRRGRAIDRKLRDVETLPQIEAGARVTPPDALPSALGGDAPRTEAA